ncbi:hypothetical protein [Phyllobacterium ifriqiyense]|uniref:hypothetical protein n=1 Tax=Phyllobacterium ifriqiyense TaxID=314238 RepID=UPI00339B2659
MSRSQLAFPARLLMSVFALLSGVALLSYGISYDQTGREAIRLTRTLRTIEGERSASIISSSKLRTTGTVRRESKVDPRNGIM